MQREVCLKHRNNRHEIILRVRTQIRVGSGVCSFLSYAARASQPAPLICGHRSRAGLLSANQVMPVQLRLTAPISKHVMCAAGASLRSGNSKSPRDRGSTGTPCQFIRAQQREYAELIARGKLQGGRVKTHGCVRPANLRAFCRGARWDGTAS